MTRWTSWWHALSGPAKFRAYTRFTFQGALAAVIVAMAVTARSPWSVLGIVVAGLAAVLAVEARTDFALSAESVSPRLAVPVAATVSAAVWLTCVVVTRLAGDESVATQARLTGGYAAVLAAFAIVSFLPHRWWVLLGLSLATGLAFASSPATGLGAAALTLIAGGFLIGTTLLTVWGLRVVDELEHAKEVEAELQVAEERLRFSRDLHDVVGRGFSAIAVKSELAVALSRSGDTGRAAAEMDEVRTLAVESMGQMRTLVRGYRGIDLISEVAGARSLLSAAGCRLVVEGDPAEVPARFHEVAAWVVREGTTNIVEHSSATAAALTFGDGDVVAQRPPPRPGGRAIRTARPRGAARGRRRDPGRPRDRR